VTDTEIGGGAVEVMAIAALAVLVASDTEVAVRVTEAGEGTLAGAVKVTELAVMLLSEPQVVPEQPAPERLQVTPRIRASFCTVAVNVCD
jgi:hypothetical protein